MNLRVARLGAAEVFIFGLLRTRSTQAKGFAFETSAEFPVPVFVLHLCSLIFAAGVAAAVAVAVVVRGRGLGCNPGLEGLAPRRCEAFDSSLKRSMESGFKGLQLCLCHPSTAESQRSGVSDVHRLHA